MKGAKLLRHYGTKLNLPLPTGEVDFVSERSEFTKSGEGTIFKVINDTRKKCAFTLSEVLIVLAVLGVVAAIVIPDLVQDARDMAFKTAYKKAYRDVNEAYDLMKLNDEEFEEIECSNSEACPHCCYSSSFGDNFKLLAKQFRATKTCFSNNAQDCWECDKGQAGTGTAPDYYGCRKDSPAFIDSSGRAWAMYSYLESGILVDTNGFGGPNELGQDRWPFSLPSPRNASTNQGLIVPMFNFDIDATYSLNYYLRWCPRRDCKYRSWLK